MNAKAYKVAVLFSGRGTNLAALLDQQGLYQISVAISNRPRAGGLQIAKDQGVPVACIDHQAFPGRAEFEAALLEEFDAYTVDLIVLAGFMRILTNFFIDRWLGRLINLHPSLLPKYPGLKPHQQALASKDDRHGTTVHYVTSDLDAGPVIAQSSVPILPNDDVESLQMRTLKVEHLLLPKVVNGCALGYFSYTNHQAYYQGELLPKTGLAPEMLDAFA